MVKSITDDGMKIFFYFGYIKLDAISRLEKIDILYICLILVFANISSDKIMIIIVYIFRFPL